MSQEKEKQDDQTDQSKYLANYYLIGISQLYFSHKKKLFCCYHGYLSMSTMTDI